MTKTKPVANKKSKTKSTAPVAPKDAEIVFVRGDDWEGVYLNGNLLEDGHNIDPAFMLAELIGMKIVSVEIKEVEVVEGGRLPMHIEDVVWS